jgi:hypothetical protein
MKVIGKTLGRVCAVLLVALFLTVLGGASAGDSYPPYSQAKVVAHLPLTGGATQMFLQQQGKTQYLYVQQPAQPGYTVINVTKPARPRLVRHAPIETRTVMGSGLMITEVPNTSAPVEASADPANTEGADADSAVRESVHVLDINSPAHPPAVDSFDGVTSIVQDPARHLIYLSNGNGVWILSLRPTLPRHHCGSSDATSVSPNCN